MGIPLPAGVHVFKCTFAWLLPGGVLKEDSDVRHRQETSNSLAHFEAFSSVNVRFLLLIILGWLLLNH